MDHPWVDLLIDRKGRITLASDSYSSVRETELTSVNQARALEELLILRGQHYPTVASSIEVDREPALFVSNGRCIALHGKVFFLGSLGPFP
jgi:hypothetical protein